MRNSLTPWLFLLPSILGTALFILLPLLDAVRRSFFTAMGGRFTGVGAYAEVFSNGALRLAAGNTARFTLVGVPLLLLLSLALALLVFAAADGAGSGMARTGFLLPMAIPTASMVAVWRLLFSTDGIINGLTGAATGWFAAPYAFPVLVGTYVWKNLGYSLLLWLAGLHAIPTARFEAAMIDGANSARRLWYITLPSLRPYVFTVAVLSLLGSFKVFREAYLLGGNYPDDSIYLLQHLWTHWFASLDIDLLCAAAVVLALLLFAAVGILRAAFGEEA